jgi:hypothetical protein
VSVDAGERMALVSRVEYLDVAARLRRYVGATLLLGSVPLLPILVLAGIPADAVVVIVGGSVTASLALHLVGPLIRRRASVRLGLVDEQVLIGSESTFDVVRPLTDLIAVELSDGTSTLTDVDFDRHDLQVAGTHTLELEFRGGDRYRIAVLPQDPVTAELIERLRRALPNRPVEKPRVVPKTQLSAPAVSTATLSASPAADVRLWEAARITHQRVLSEYGAYELDPFLYLRYPGVTDVTREPVMDFHTALEEAQALATDTYPDDAGYAGRYRTAADALRRTWVRCERDGKATGTSYLADDDISDLATAAKLYKHAQSTDHPEEKTSYLRKVEQIVADLDERGRVHLPAPVVAAIENQVRLALQPGTGGQD